MPRRDAETPPALVTPDASKTPHPLPRRHTLAELPLRTPLVARGLSGTLRERTSVLTRSARAGRVMRPRVEGFVPLARIVGMPGPAVGSGGPVGRARTLA